MTEEHRTYLFGLLEKQFGKMSTRERLIAGSIIDEAVDLATKELQEENAELDCQKNRNKFCYSCANATERCFRNEIGCPCEKYKSYKDENAELKKKNLDMQDAVTMQIYTNKANKEIADRQLTKAKEIIRELINMKSIYDTCKEVEHRFTTIAKAEAFLNSEVEK